MAKVQNYNLICLTFGRKVVQKHHAEIIIDVTHIYPLHLPCIIITILGCFIYSPTQCMVSVPILRNVQYMFQSKIWYNLTIYLNVSLHASMHCIYICKCFWRVCDVAWFYAVYLTLGLLRPSITTNNMEIYITDIGEDTFYGLPPLICHTDLTNCCRSAAENNGNGGLGQWTFPDGSVILGNGPSATAGQQFYINRNGPQIIKLSRREANNPLTPTGSYCCTVPTTGGEMTLCANLSEWIKL